MQRRRKLDAIKFDAASIYFCDIVDFGSFVEDSSPSEVKKMKNFI